MNSTPDQIIQCLREEQDYLREEYGVDRIALFGSCASGRMETDTDVDLVVTFNRPVGLRFMDLCECLESKLHRPVDILTPSGLDSIRNAEIMQHIKDSIIYV